MINELVTLIVRGVNERTTSGCVSLLKQLFKEESIYLLNVAPFSKAIKAMFEVGQKEKKEWLFCVDADVLISEEGVKKLVDKAFSTSENVFQIQGLVLDKFFSVYRPAGNHLYRMAYAEKAISLIPEEGTSLRPETDMLNRMSEAGHPWEQCDAIVGIHDFEQYYTDIYRKCFLQAHKHDWLIAELEKYWYEMAVTDNDFQVALWGALSGKLYRGTVLVDKRFMEKEALDVLSIKRIHEKENISDTIDLREYVRNILENYPKQQHADFQKKIFPFSIWNRTFDLKVSPISTGIGSKLKDFGRKALYYLGHIFIGTGNRLQKFKRPE